VEEEAQEGVDGAEASAAEDEDEGEEEPAEALLVEEEAQEGVDEAEAGVAGDEDEGEEEPAEALLVEEEAQEGVDEVEVGAAEDAAEEEPAENGKEHWKPENGSAEPEASGDFPLSPAMTESFGATEEEVSHRDPLPRELERALELPEVAPVVVPPSLEQGSPPPSPVMPQAAQGLHTLEIVLVQSGLGTESHMKRCIELGTRSAADLMHLAVPHSPFAKSQRPAPLSIASSPTLFSDMPSHGIPGRGQAS